MNPRLAQGERAKKKFLILRQDEGSMFPWR